MIFVCALILIGAKESGVHFKVMFTFFDTHHGGKGIMDLEQYLEHIIPQLLKSSRADTHLPGKRIYSKVE